MIPAESAGGSRETRMNMMQITKKIEQWTGWCPHPQGIRAAPAVLSFQPAVRIPAGPEGNGGRSGRIGRGMALLAESFRSLSRERELLWIPILAGLVTGFTFLAFFIVHTLAAYPYGFISEPATAVLTFGIEFSCIFFLAYIFAAFILGRSSDDERGGQGSVRTGLARAWAFRRPIFCWSGILAITATLLFFLILPVVQGPLFALVSQFPFDYLLVPEAHGTGPIAGGFHILYASAATFLLLAINIFLFIMTALVIPSLVLGKTTLAGAIARAARLTGRVWGEILVCVIAPCLVILAFSLLSGSFFALFSQVQLDSPFWYEFYYKGGWGVAAGAYMAVGVVTTLIAVSVTGIALRDVYEYATTGRMPVRPGCMAYT